MRASAPLLLPGRPRAADAVPSASTSRRADRSGKAIQANPNCQSHPCDWLLSQRKSLSAADSPCSSRGALASTIVPFFTTRIEASEQAGALQGLAICAFKRHELNNVVT